MNFGFLRDIRTSSLTERAETLERLLNSRQAPMLRAYPAHLSYSTFASLVSDELLGCEAEKTLNQGTALWQLLQP